MSPTAEEISVNFDFTGKVALITGATNGLGKEACRVMVLRKCKVLLGARTLEKGIQAKKEILAEIGEDKADLIEPIEVNISTLAQVREFVKRFESRSDKTIHILMNNAGANTMSKKVTPEGFEENFGVNHLSPFLLTLLLLPLLKATADKSGIAARIIFVASGSHFRLEKVDFEDYNSDSNGDVGPPQLIRYAKSKLGNLLVARELHERLQQSFPDKFVCNSLAPGVVMTGLVDKDLGTQGSLDFFEKLKKQTPNLEILSLGEGAATQVFLAGDEEAGKVGGFYYWKCKPVYASPLGEDVQLQKQIWPISEKLVGLTYQQAIHD